MSFVQDTKADKALTKEMLDGSFDDAEAASRKALAGK